MEKHVTERHKDNDVGFGEYTHGNSQSVIKWSLNPVKDTGSGRVTYKQGVSVKNVLLACKYRLIELEHSKFKRPDTQAAINNIDNAIKCLENGWGYLPAEIYGEPEF